MKQFRPVSADYSKSSTLSSVFGIGTNENGDKVDGANNSSSSGAVMLINCKYSNAFTIKLCALLRIALAMSEGITDIATGLAPFSVSTC
jgi:hypothetical protein